MPLTGDAKRLWQKKYVRRRYWEDPAYRKKHKARVKAYRAYKRYKKIKPICSKCGSKIHVEMHHPDYEKPRKVVWLCDKCHRKIHY